MTRCSLVREVCPFCGFDFVYCDSHTPESESDAVRDQHVKSHVEEMTDV